MRKAKISLHREVFEFCVYTRLMNKVYSKYRKRKNEKGEENETLKENTYKRENRRKEKTN